MAKCRVVAFAMKRWREVSGCSVKDRRQALVEAIRAFPSRSLAARALGINRQYLYELLAAYGVSVGATDRPDSVGSPDRSDSVGPSDSTDSHAPRATLDAVGTTSKDSLTYARTGPTFAPTMSTAVATTETQDATAEPTVRVNLDLPKSAADQLELWSVLDKQKSGASRASKSAVVLDLIRRRQAEKDAAE
jgi:hypothetical protein